MGTRTFKIYANKESFPSQETTGKCLKLFRNMWVGYVKDLLVAIQSTVESTDERLLTDEELNEMATEESFECEDLQWEYSVCDEPTCVTGILKLSSPKYVPQIVGTHWGIPTQYPWIKFSESFSND